MKLQEDFLHYLWDSRKIPSHGLRTTAGAPLIIHHPGTSNPNAGPDFLHALIAVGGTSWAGHVEMHLRSSSWYEHGHERDERYQNVVLHVVWEHDREVTLADGSRLPVLELKGVIPERHLEKYNRLLGVHPRIMNCSGQRDHVPFSVIESWYKTLFAQRLQYRFDRMLHLAPNLRTHWEELMFRAVFRYMGARVNAEAYYSLAAAVGIEKARKIVSAGEELEIVLHGMSGLLEDPGVNEVCQARKKEFLFLRRKYDLVPERVIRPVFFRLRPPSFPTVRLSQLAELFQNSEGLFSQLLAAKTTAEMRAIFRVTAHRYWTTRYTYRGPVSRHLPKTVSVARTDLILLNAVFPILYAYSRNRGRDICEQLLEMAASIPAENNQVLRSMKKEGLAVRHAADSQAVLELHDNFCSKNRCLHCKIGTFIIGG